MRWDEDDNTKRLYKTTNSDPCQNSEPTNTFYSSYNRRFTVRYDTTVYGALNVLFICRFMSFYQKPMDNQYNIILSRAFRKTEITHLDIHSLH